VKKISILASCGNGEDVLEGLYFCVTGWERRDLQLFSMCAPNACGTTNHLDRSVCEIDECRGDFAILPSGIQCCRIPEGEDSADKLCKTFCPVSVCIRFSFCSQCQYLAFLARSGGHTGVEIVELQKVACSQY
jgi:hypothetical protein